jgi:hypothetical protein
MPIIRSSRVLYKWLLPVVFGAWFSSCWYSVELRVVCPVCGLLGTARKPDTQPSDPRQTDNLKTKARSTTSSNHLYNTLELLMMGIMVPEICWARSKICNKNSSVASSWHFISTYYQRCRVKTTSYLFHMHSNSNTAPMFVHCTLWWYIEDGGITKSYEIGNFCSQTFISAKCGCCYTRVWL